MTLNDCLVEESWKARLGAEFNKDYMLSLQEKLELKRAEDKTIYPKQDNIFFALNGLSFDRVKVVILGQDPYHGFGQAQGLAFSVPKEVALPPSLKNIYKELYSDLSIDRGLTGDLSDWAEQGVLLLNSVLTVEAGDAASHQGLGWEQFTDRIISILNSEKQSLVFLLWGSYAHKKGAVIDKRKHLVLKSTHPSPLSAYRGFFGCGHFSACNQYLKENNIEPINW